MRAKAASRAEKNNGSGTEQKIYDLLPVLRQISLLHRAGLHGFDICAENIAPIGARGTLKLLPKSLCKSKIRPGYSAPEQYYSDSTQGAWTDVYKASALLFFIMTGQLPAAAFERRQGEPVFLSPVPENLSAVANAVGKGLAIDISQRAQSLDILCEAVQALPQGETKKAAPDKKTKRLALVIAAAAALFFAAFAVSEINYAQAVKHVGEGEFRKAERSVSGVPGFYKDTKRLESYINACILMDEGEYEQAENLFAAMGDYRGCALMISETKYRRALHLLESGDFEQAQAQFEALGSYGDSHNMAKEAAYSRASALAESGDYIPARSVISAVHPYKDSETLISGLNESIYKKAVEHFKKQEYLSAADYFAAVPGYKLSDSYAVVCGALSGGEIKKGKLKQLMSCADEIDLSHIFMREDIISLFLEGTWKDAKGSTLIVAEDKSITANLPWEEGIYCYFGDAAVYIKTRGGSDVKAFEFEYIDKNTISVYCCKNGKTYTLSRQ